MLEKCVLNSCTAFSEVTLVLHAEAGWLRSLAITNTDLSLQTSSSFLFRKSVFRQTLQLPEGIWRQTLFQLHVLTCLHSTGRKSSYAPPWCSTYTAMYCQHTHTQEVLGTQLWDIPGERNTFPRQLQLLKQTAHRWVSRTHITYKLYNGSAKQTPSSRILHD